MAKGKKKEEEPFMRVSHRAQPLPKADDEGPRPPAGEGSIHVDYVVDPMGLQADDPMLVTLTFQQKVEQAVVTQQAKIEALAHTFTFPDGVTLKTAFDLNGQQRGALESLAEWVNTPNIAFYNLKGYAGTGKTTIMKLFVQYVMRSRVRDQAEAIASGASGVFDSPTGDMILAAPTHRARQVLYNLAGSEISHEHCLTIHSLLALRPDFDIEQLDMRNLGFSRQEGKQSKMPRRGLVILDECSMIGDKLLMVLYKVATDLETKICFVGDSAQLKPVKQDTVSQVFSIKYRSELTQVMRQSGGNPISFLLETIRNNQHKKTDSFIRYNRVSASNEGIIFTTSTQVAKVWVVEKILSEEFEKDPTYVRVLCGTNTRCAGFNTSMRNARYGAEAQEYMIGELLSGYANYGTDPDSYDFSSSLITNSADYIVVSAHEQHKKILDMEVPGWQLSLVDADIVEVPVHRRRRKSVFIISRHCGLDQMHLLSQELQRLQQLARAAKGPAKKLAWNKFFAFQESFCTAADYVEGTYTRIKRTLGYGYAMTVHKSQGGTYSYVLVDETDIDTGFPNDHQLRHQLKYVALSRASKQVLCLTNQPIQEPVFSF